MSFLATLLNNIVLYFEFLLKYHLHILQFDFLSYCPKRLYFVLQIFRPLHG